VTSLVQSIKKLALDKHFITCGIYLYNVAIIIGLKVAAVILIKEKRNEDPCSRSN
jgi:hypothetical protein